MLAHRFLGVCSSSLSISCLYLVSVLIAAACARLWSSFRWCSESPLLAHPKTMVSCLLGKTFSWTPSQLAVVCYPPPFRLCSHSQPQSSPWDLTSEAGASAPSPHLPTPLLLCSPLWLRSYPCHPLSPPVKGLPSVWKLFLLHSSLPEVQVLSLFFCLCVFSFALPSYLGSLLPFGRSEVFCQRSVGVL